MHLNLDGHDAYTIFCENSSSLSSNSHRWRLQYSIIMYYSFIKIFGEILREISIHLCSMFPFSFSHYQIYISNLRSFVVSMNWLSLIWNIRLVDMSSPGIKMFRCEEIWMTIFSSNGLWFLFQTIRVVPVLLSTNKTIFKLKWSESSTKGGWKASLNVHFRQS